METFNIKILHDDNPVTLTVLPTSTELYKIIYFGAILGAVEFEKNKWKAVPKSELEAGDLPFYEDDQTADRIKIVLDNTTVSQIGEEINQHIKSLPRE